MIDKARYRPREHAGKLVVGATGAVLALSLVSLGTTLSGSASAGPEAQPDQLVVKLEADLEKTQRDLRTSHDRVLADLSGVDHERAGRDEATGRSVLLSLTDTSASSRTVKQAQVLLDTRYEFLDNKSRTLVEFIPGWMAATRQGRGVATTFALRELTIDVSGVRGLDYSYVGTARLESVTASGSGSVRSEYVLFTYSTSQDGTVTSFEVFRASSRTRDALVAAGSGSRPARSSVSTRPLPTRISTPHEGGG